MFVTADNYIKFVLCVCVYQGWSSFSLVSVVRIWSFLLWTLKFLFVERPQNLNLELLYSFF